MARMASIYMVWILILVFLQENHVAQAWVYSGISVGSTSPTKRQISIAPLLSAATTQVACANIPGSDPERPQKVNQDAHFSFQRDNVTVIGVLDGHGLKGHQVTNFLKDQLAVRLQQHLSRVLDGNKDNNDDDDPTYVELWQKQQRDLVELGNAEAKELVNGDPIAQALVDSFLQAQLDARRDTSVPTGRSGTTCVVCVLIQSNESDFVLYTAAVGDSRAILLLDGTNVQQIAAKTTVKVSSERERIQRSEGHMDGSGNVFYGPVGIAMTRSLGNAVMLRAGVLPIPIVSRYELNNNRNFTICAATDGVFDALKDDQVTRILVSPTSVTDAARQVCEEAKLAWLGDFLIETKVDDITCAIVRYSAS